MASVPATTLVAQLVLRHDGEDGALLARAVIADELSCGDLLAELDAGPAEVAEGLAGLAGALAAAPVMSFWKPSSSTAHALLLDHLDRQVDGEADRCRTA